MKGRVVSKKMLKTAVVIVERQSRHPLYKKSFIRTKKYLVEDPIEVKEGDLVELVKIRPISRMKHFQIAKVLGKRLEEITEEKLKKSAKAVIEEIMPKEKEKNLEGGNSKLVEDAGDKKVENQASSNKLPKPASRIKQPASKKEAK